MTVSATNGMHAWDSYLLTVTNAWPTLSVISDHAALPDGAALSFAFTVGDFDTPPQNLLVTATSSNTNLVPNEHLIISTGPGSNRTLTVTPLANQRGSTEIRLVVQDELGGSNRRSFVLTFTPFLDLDAGLSGVRVGAVAWGDYDNDGDLDLIVTGKMGNNAWDDSTQLYCNNLEAGFSVVPVALPRVWLGSVVWGDYDGDGDLDLFLSGYSARLG